MTKRTLVLWPDKILTELTVEVKPEEFNTDELKELVADLFEILHKTGGIGLAAPQIGVNKKIFVASLGASNTPDTGFTTPKVFINPAPVGSMEESEMEEGCLSFPGVYHKVKRPKEVHVLAQNVTGDFFTEKAYNLYAHVIQHEYDHLRGITLYDKMSNLKRDVTRRKMAKYAKSKA
jgi:peptide deformylase